MRNRQLVAHDLRLLSLSRQLGCRRASFSVVNILIEASMHCHMETYVHKPLAATKIAFHSMFLLQL
jgi:hypothetical protein